MNSLEFLQYFLSLFLQTVFVIGVAAWFERFSKDSAIKGRLWHLCFVGLVCLCVTGLLLPRIQWANPWSFLSVATRMKIAEWQVSVGFAVLMLWGLGAIAMLMHWMGQFLLMQRFIRKSELADSRDLDRILQAIPPHLIKVGSRTIQFRKSDEEVGPFCYQFHRPVIFLPDSIIHEDSSILKNILVHELTHLHTQHPLQLFVQKVVRALLWFNPLVWASFRRARLIREFVCDDESIENEHEVASYLRTLLCITERKSKLPSSVMNAGRSIAEVTIRARRLVAKTHQSESRKQLFSVPVLLAAILIASQLNVPTNPLASSSRWSPWPTWTASVLYTMDLPVRDFDVEIDHINIRELRDERHEHILDESIDVD